MPWGASSLRRTGRQLDPAVAQLGVPGQPAELAPVFVMLASDEASYVSGTMVGVMGGRPII